MNNENLTQEEAQRRSELLTVESYDVHVDLTNASDTSFDAYPTATTVRFSAQPNSETFIDYIHQSIDSIKLNGANLNINDAVEGSRILLGNLQAENILTIHGRSYFSRSGEGMHRYVDPSDQKVYLYTQYEPADARRVFPNFEQPDLKAIFNFRITAPKNWVVSSNAELEREIEDPSNSGISKRVFKSTEKISTYITTILAGEYFVAQDFYEPKSKINSGSFPLVAYCRQSLKEHFDYEDIFAVTKAGLDFFQDLFDFAYPYPKYEQAFVPEYNLGAMENPGMVTFTESYLFESGATQAQLEGRANVICHEMSHMWFGDLVTMKWWNDLWLKESFAEFMGTLGAQEAAGYQEAWVTFANNRKAWAYEQDQLPSTHPIVADIPHLEAARQNFDGITYAKGSSVLKQLVAYVGFETFIDAARVYFKRFAWGNTTLDDFLGVLDEVSNRDVLTWSAAWLQTQGLSSLATERVFDDESQLAELIVSQHLPEGTPAELGRPHQLKLETFIVKNDALSSTGLVSLTIPQGDSSSVRVPLSENEQEQVASADLLVLNAEDLTYAKVILGTEDGQEIATQLVSTIDNPLTRGLIWGSLWNQVRDASLTSETFVHAVEHNIPREKSATLLSTIAAQAQIAIQHYTPEDKQQDLWDSLGGALLDALHDAEAGGDAQLIMLRNALGVAAHSETTLPLAQEVSQGATTDTSQDIAGVDGVANHPALGWSALIALASQGKITAADIDSARNVHSSATTERGHAQALAALPTAEAKKKAFETVLESVEISNDLLTATARGFQAGSVGLHTEFLDPYFEALLGTWQKRSIGMASRVVLGLFPHASIAQGDAETHPVVLRASAWLKQNPEAPTALRRLIIEELDDAQRSLRAQAFNQ
ncbi:MAG: aminopeptidase N [Rothia sp. (in: high G+C Gram-positive bacteria)]|nr:aminopeptidase N [Rothia sp. (in: high G+C Gram-positive bacteria)]